MSMTIYTMTHKPFTPPPDSLYQPLQVGRALHEDLGYLCDNQGDNISEQNPFYSELTGLYWVWKNDYRSDYVGCAHYRRYLINEENQLYTEAELQMLLTEYDFVTTKLLTLDYPYYDAFADRHNSHDLDVTAAVIKELKPAYYENYIRLVHENRTYFGNMMVMPKPLYNSYMDFLFPILFEVQNRIDISGYDGYQQRIFGFLSEFLLYVWSTTNHLHVKESHVGMVSEKVETRELKEKLADYFKQKNISGAKACFQSYYEKRPDILMEASDLNHECRLAMQAITSLEWEQKEYGRTRLEHTTDFYKLISFYRELNQIAKQNKRVHSLAELKENPPSFQELQFLKEQQVSEMEWQIALLLQNETI